MKNTKDVVQLPPEHVLPFPTDWLKSHPRKVEDMLSGMPVPDQLRCVLLLRGKERQDFVLLSPCAKELIRALPPEEVFHMVKEIGARDALPILSLASEEQIQYVFDIEWWAGDKFRPDKAREWLALLGQCEEPKILEWLQSEEFDQKVMVMQSLIKVFKRDEMTDAYEGVEGLEHFTLDQVYDIFFKFKESAPVKNLIKTLRAEDEKLYHALLEAVIWYPVTPTVEKAYQWRLSRTAERGIPDFKEAFEIYSGLAPEALKLEPPELDLFTSEGEYQVAPHYPLACLDHATFFSRCLGLMKAGSRIDTLLLELVYLANKVIVADRRDPSDLNAREEVLRKVLGYINIGLELGAEGDLQKGAGLLERVRMQPLFQVGYQKLMQLKWKAEEMIRDHHALLEYLLTPGDWERLSAFALRFPQVGEFVGEGEPLRWRDFEKLEDIRAMEAFLDRWSFYLRFSRHGLSLDEKKLERTLEACDLPSHRSDMDLLTCVLTALARFTLFKEVSCQPLPEVAAKSFLEIIFLPGIFRDETRSCKDELIQAFREKLLGIPMAWTGEDRRFLDELIHDCVSHLRLQFGRLDPKGKIEWRFTRGLCLKR